MIRIQVALFLLQINIGYCETTRDEFFTRKGFGQENASTSPASVNPKIHNSDLKRSVRWSVCPENYPENDIPIAF